MYAKQPGADLSRVASVASFFISRVDTEIDRRLDDIGSPEALALRGKGAVAQGKLAYQLFQQTFSGHRWEALAAKGAVVQRPLWASTSTKNPAYPDTLYVDELIGPDTVNTLPDATIEAFADHGTWPAASTPTSTRQGGVDAVSATSASISTTSAPRSSAKAWPASRRASTSCSTPSRRRPPNYARERHADRRSARRHGPRAATGASARPTRRVGTRPPRAISPTMLDLKIASAALEEMREAFKMFAPFRDIPKVTIFGSARTQMADPLVHAGPRRRRPARRRGLDGHHRRRARDHAGRDGRRRARQLDRRVDPAAVRAGRQPGHRRRRQVRQHEVLLHPQADADQGEQGLHLPAWRVRHARRDVRAADAHPDRQGPAGADRVPRHAGRPVLGDGRTTSSATNSSNAGSLPRPTPSCTSSPTTSRRPSTRSSASTATTTRSATSGT